MCTDFEKQVFAFIQEIQTFEYQIQSIDRIWDILFLDLKSKPHHMRVSKYRDTFYIMDIDGDLDPLEVLPGKAVKAGQTFGSRSSWGWENESIEKAWGPVILALRKWLKLAKKNWIKAGQIALEAYPLNRRQGIIPHSLIRETFPKAYRLDKIVGKTKAKKFIRLVEDGCLRDHDEVHCKTMTVNTYLDYCKIAYIAGKRKGEHLDEKMPARRMYEIFADGRDEGLLEIDPDSEQEFADWIDDKHPKKTSGGHPWEIKRGGNTTHIDLAVYRPNYRGDEGYTIKIIAGAITRLGEAINMFLALVQAGYPVAICDPQGIRKRLLAHDNVGIVPCHDSLHRADQDFAQEMCVYDVMYYDSFGRFKRRLTPFITWEALPAPLKPA